MINCLRKLKRSIKYRKYKEKKVIIPSSSYISDDVVFDGFNRVGEKVSLFHSHIGTGTYICNNVEFHDVEIGRYCSIGSNICLLNGTHPTRDFVSTHPSFYSNANQAGFSFAEVNIFEEHLYLRKEDRIAIEIGNDVWIGNNVIIMGGIRIGNGAIIAAGSVVTKDVPPYSIVGGVPAKKIRSRFSQEDIEYLNRVQWWEKDYEWLYKNAKYFDSVENLKKVLP